MTLTEEPSKYKFRNTPNYIIVDIVISKNKEVLEWCLAPVLVFYKDIDVNEETKGLKRLIKRAAYPIDGAFEITRKKHDMDIILKTED